MTTDPIKALVDLGPELEKRLRLIADGVMINERNTDIGQANILNACLAAIEALTPMAEGTSVVVPLYDLQKIILTIFNGSDPLDERNGARKSYDNLRSILAASPSASTGKEDVVERVAKAIMETTHPTWKWEICSAYHEIFKYRARAALAAIGER